jgi:hypothetical protein
MSQKPASTEASPSAPAGNGRDAFEAKLKLYDRVLATLTALGLILGGVWGVYTYFGIQHQTIELRERELAFMVFNEKKHAYLALIDAAAEITASKNRQEVSEKAPLFLKLYYGRAHVIAEADRNVSKKKVTFRNKLMKYLEDKIDTPPHEYFGGAALALTKACQVHVDPRTIEEIQNEN